MSPHSRSKCNSGDFGWVARTGGRRVLPSHEFRERKRAYPGYDRAIAWEKTHI